MFASRVGRRVMRACHCVKVIAEILPTETPGDSLGLSGTAWNAHRLLTIPYKTSLVAAPLPKITDITWVWQPSCPRSPVKRVTYMVFCTRRFDEESRLCACQLDERFVVCPVWMKS